MWRLTLQTRVPMTDRSVLCSETGLMRLYRHGLTHARSPPPLPRKWPPCPLTEDCREQQPLPSIAQLSKWTPRCPTGSRGTGGLRQQEGGRGRRVRRGQRPLWESSPSRTSRGPRSLGGAIASAGGSAGSSSVVAVSSTSPCRLGRLRDVEGKWGNRAHSMTPPAHHSHGGWVFILYIQIRTYSTVRVSGVNTFDVTPVLRIGNRPRLVENEPPERPNLQARAH